MPSADKDTEARTESRGRLVVRAAADAINDAERLLCAGGAVSRPAVAEGLALGGRRAATLLVPENAGQTGSSTASANAPWVHHRRGHGTSAGFAFELSGTTAQDGVDHCLVAHDLTRRIGRPGLCTFVPARTQRLERVRLPDDGLLRELEAPVEGGADVAGQARRAFERVAELTGRAVAPVTVEDDEAEVAIVSSAATLPLARRLARALAASGTSCRTVALHLVRPFPSSSLANALAGVRASVLLPLDSVLDPAIPLVSTVLATGLDQGEMLSEIRSAFGLPADAARQAREETPARTIGWTARPDGDWAHGFLLDAAARLEGAEEIAFGGGTSTLIIGPDASPDLPAGLALCAHPAYVEDDGLLDGMAAGGTLLVASATDCPDGWWEALAPETRTAILGRELNLHWIDLAENGVDLADPAAVRELLLEAFLSEGGRRIEPKSLESLHLAREIDFKEPEPELPVMPEAPEDSDATTDWSEAARHFHLTGDGARSAAEPTSAEPLQPVVLAALDEAARLGSRYPLFVGNAVTPFEKRLEALFEALEEQKQPATILTRHLPRLSHVAGRLASRTHEPLPVEPLLDEALREFGHGFELSEAAAESLRGEGERLRAAVAADTDANWIVGLDRATLPCLHAAAIRRVRRERRAVLVEEIDTLVHGLGELLAVDDLHDSDGPATDALESSFGAEAGELFDPKKLAESLPRHRGSVRLGPERRARVERALETLRDGREMDRDVDLIVVQPDASYPGAAIPGARVVTHPRGLGAVIGLFDGMAGRYVELFRALRVARLEVDGAYDPELHDAPLARFDWQALPEDELLTLPRLVVLETAARLRGAGLGAFAELLLSGRPVHVLVEQSTSEFGAAAAWQGLGGFHPGLGYVALAHREAFVIESSLVCPERLTDDLEKMAASLRPGAALVAVPAWTATVPAWLQLLAAEQARSVPSFTYDPEAGLHWADRFDLSNNPQPQRPWPLHEVRYLDEQGAGHALEQPFTFAHAVALDPAYRNHFRIVPTAAWSDGQMELSEYLAAPAAAVERKVPFIWVVGDGNRLARALLTRELAHASRDRLRAWRILQELAGTDNEYARRAAEAARAAFEAEHATEVEQARTGAASDAMNRLARVLMDFDADAVPAPAPTAMTGEPAAAEASAEPASAAAAPADAADTAFESPWIESALCTSCQDCININNRLFKYDANKQAFIADASAGTYEQLVRAAEKCPARCIHPGLPAPGDTTVTDGVLARAAKFN